MRMMVWATMAILLMGCDDTLDDTVGFKNLTASYSKVYFLDTLSVVASTVLVDSLDTSTSGRVLVGAYDDAYFGKTSSHAYMQFGLQLSEDTGVATSWSVSSNATFDRAELVLFYDSYYYGDTTVNQSIDIFQLNKPISGRLVGAYDFMDTTPSIFYTTAGLYNVSETAYDPTPVASYTYRPYPGSGDSLEIRLADKIGSAWFAYHKANDLIMQYNGNFIDEFNGLMIANASPSNQSVMGFDAEKTKIRLWYWDQENDVKVIKYHDFPLYQQELQYNKIETDRSGTSLSSLKAGVALPASATNGETYLQGGSGIFTRLDFPSASRLSNIAILQAELVLRPKQGTMSGFFPLPPTVSVYLADDNNIPVNILVDTETALILTSTQYIDAEFNLKNYYSLTMTNYLTALINGSGEAYHLMIGVTDPGTGGTVDRAVLATGREDIQFKIYYTNLKSISQ